MVDQVATDDTTTTLNGSWEVNTAADLARLRNDGKLLTSQELKELNARIKALEDMARMEDRLRTLESRKRPRSEFSESALPTENPTTEMQQQARSSRNSSSHQDRQATIRPSIELDSSDSDSESSSNMVI